jgi:cell division protein FtsB
MRRAVRILIVSVVAVAIVFLFVLPGRTLLAQNRSLATTRHRADVLAAENARLAQQVSKLQSSSQIEQIARQQYGLVKPGEKAYAIIPPAATTTTTTTTVPPTTGPQTTPTP